MEDQDKPEDETLNIELEDLDEDELPPATRPAATGDELVIELEDLDDVPDTPQRAYPAAPAGGYPPPAGAAGYPAVDAKAGYDLYAKAKKSPVAAIFGNLMLQMFIAGLIGGLLAWVANEPWTQDTPEGATPDLSNVYLHSVLFFGIVGALIGAALGAVEGLLTGAYSKMAPDAGIGLLIGAVGGGFAGFAGQFVYASITRPDAGMTVQVLGRTVGWALAGMAIGLAQGIRYLNFNRILNGLIGGAVGGFVGGLLFDPIGMIVGGGEVSRLIALGVIGAATGAAIGLLEEVRKEAWFTIVEGPLTGKEFILYKQVTSIGSAGYCDIPLLKDPNVAPEHARIQQSGNAFVLASLVGAEAVHVNGRPTGRHSLSSGDLVHIGSTAFFYQDRAVHQQPAV